MQRAWKLIPGDDRSRTPDRARVGRSPPHPASNHLDDSTNRRLIGTIAASAARDLDTVPTHAKRENQHATAHRIKLNRLIPIRLPRYFILGFSVAAAR